MVILMWWCGALALINFIYCVWNAIKDNWARATFHLVAGIWMWYIVTII